MRSIMPRSLRGLLLLNESALLALVIATAALSGLWAHFWTQSSEEALRLGILGQVAERIRGDMYRQFQEVTHARLTDNLEALRVYASYETRVETQFAHLADLARDDGERAAVEYVRDSYRVVHEDMDKVFTDPNEISNEVRMKLLDPAYEEWMLGEFESALRVLEDIVAVRQEALAARRSAWTRWTPVLVPVSIGLAVLLLLYSRYRLAREFVAPLGRLMTRAEEISRGNLESGTAAGGVEEIRLLASTLDDMGRRLARIQRTLIESERQAALGALVPVVAHNIRNPLASIRATAQVMDETSTAEENAYARGAIIDTVDRLERWVTSLLSYLHPLEPRLGAYRLGEVVEGSLAPLARRIERKRLRIERARWEDQDPELQLDRDLLEQAIFALLANAVDASPDGAALRLELRASEADVVLLIDDEGPGIDFEPEPQELRPGPSTKAYGTGLGIPIAHRICQAHGGNVRIERRENGGTRASVTLPLAATGGP